ncbi:MAG: tRNA epoxyqueuosine(34) reductase QueG [Pseudomonadales bacterium]
MKDPGIDPALEAIAQQLPAWAAELGFDRIGVTDTDLEDYAPHFRRWLEAGNHGTMDWMVRHADLRLDPRALVPGTLRILSARMPYPGAGADALATLREGDRAYISRYALGRDYHRVLRQRLARLARRIDTAARDLGGQYRAFTDSAPVLEKPLGEKAGLGWIGKHTLLIDRAAGSWFFLGEIYTNLPLPLTPATPEDHCGNCRACMTVCPTGAIIGPRQLDARRCIAYLTIEHDGAIPEPLRPLIGNRVFGCDDCQIHCPWNRFAQRPTLPDFAPRHNLDRADLRTLFAWTEAEYLARTEGSALRRAGYERWRRNLAVALGNGPRDLRTIELLRSCRPSSTPLVQTHIDWALARLGA